MNKLVQQKGSAAIVTVIVIVVAALVLLGFVFWQNIAGGPRSTDDASVKPASTSDPIGWVRQQDNDTAVSYAAPDGVDVTVETFQLSDAIPVGFGAPVFVAYDANQGWQTYQSDANNQPTIAVEENLVKPLTVQAADKYTSNYYDTGDGQTVQTRVLVVTTQIYQFSFTQQLGETDVMTFVQSLKF
jgi:cytoskeletal protein RodZ